MTDCEKKVCCDIEEDQDAKQKEKLAKWMRELGFCKEEDPNEVEKSPDNT